MRELSSVVLTGFAILTARGDFTLHGENADLFASREYSRTAAAQEAPERIDSFDLKNYPVSSKTYLDRASALALAGGALALQDAKIALPPNNSDDFGITLGTHFGCLDAMKTFYDGIREKGARGASPLIFSHSYFNAPISLCAIEFGLGGYHATFCSGENSGFDAIEAAHDAIALGHARAMLCGAVEPFSEAARELGAEAHNECAAFLVLQSVEDANENAALFDARVLAAARDNETFARYGAARGVLAAGQIFAQPNDASTRG